jgi:hypothetical protein
LGFISTRRKSLQPQMSKCLQQCKHLVVVDPFPGMLLLSLIRSHKGKKVGPDVVTSFRLADIPVISTENRFLCACVCGLADGKIKSQTADGVCGSERKEELPTPAKNPPTFSPLGSRLVRGGLAIAMSRRRFTNQSSSGCSPVNTCFSPFSLIHSVSC